MKTGESEKGGEERGRKVTRSGGDGEAAAAVVPVHHFDLAHDLRPEPAAE